ncbi:hypothetical protein SAMD00079811_75230 [Scytonema sp. HK-05]|nr:hypothetical protein SAMD00079811_75230 [Scytonema sp. HK-05]
MTKKAHKKITCKLNVQQLKKLGQKKRGWEAHHAI